MATAVTATTAKAATATGVLSCYTTSYPRQAGATARMNDGRLFTDYRPRCSQYPVKAAGTWGDHDARQRMVNDAESLMKATRSMLNEKIASRNPVDTMVPELYKQVCTWKGCDVIPGHFTGIGVGRIYRPEMTAAADKPEELSRATVPALFGTETPKPSDIENNCAPNDTERFWQILATTGGNARVHPYSAPRA